MELLNTLFITSEHSYLRVDNKALRVDIDKEKKIQVPVHHIGSVVCFGNVMISPAAINMCAGHGVSLVLLSRGGRFVARLEGKINGNVLLRKAQYETSQDEEFCRRTGMAIVAGKIKNTRTILSRGAREAGTNEDEIGLRDAALALLNSTRRVRNATDLNEIRGIEGDAARRYFAAINLLLRTAMRADFSMDKRSRRPPRDRLNALFSFFYTLLMNDCRSAVEAAGLDPQIGFLHAIRPGRSALALDLMEEFRAFIADRLALTLINRGQLKGEDFEKRDGGAVEMKAAARKKVLAAYQERKQDEVIHPLLGKKVSLGVLMHLQARLFARYLRGESPRYIPWLCR